MTGVLSLRVENMQLLSNLTQVQNVATVDRVTEVAVMLFGYLQNVPKRPLITRPTLVFALPIIPS